MTDKELEVAKANQRAYNYWGRIWRLNRDLHSLDPRTWQLIKIRALTYRRTYTEMVSSLGGLGGKIVLDVGCGTSEYLEWLADDCNKLVGVDISVEILKLCRKDMGKHDLDLVVADALHLPFKDGAFDASTTFQALHHFADWKKALTEMGRAAGQISLFEPNKDSVFHRLLNSVRQTFRIEQRFKQTDEDYGLVEREAGGFSSAEIVNYLNKNGMSASVSMFGMIPVSLLVNISKISSRLLFLMLAAEDIVRKAPILRSQLGGFLIIGWRARQV